MSRPRAFYLCAFWALSPVVLASDEHTPAAPDTRAAETAVERGVPSHFSWADFDGDGTLDLAAVSAAGGLQLLASAGEGRFEDVTEHAGLAGVTDAALALWADYDGDGRLDLFVGARARASLLFRNQGGVFEDVSAGSGLVSEGAVRSAHWLDHDGDGRLDLHVVTAERNLLFRGLEGGFFDATELPLLVGAIPGLPSGQLPGSVGKDAALPPALPSAEDDATRGATIGGERNAGGGRAGALSAPGSRVPLGPPSAGSATLLPFPLTCASSIKDQANPVTCLEASTTPTLGRLYPLSTNLFVALGGNVGIGTTSPAAKLHVAGTARLTDTLTLAPGGDQALDVSTGSIYKGGVLFIHTKGFDNTAVGQVALVSVTEGNWNTAIGSRALVYNTNGYRNTAIGVAALYANTSGSRSTASGIYALASNTYGSLNTATGAYALMSNRTGNHNTASGGYALPANTTGHRNTAIGVLALRFSTSGSDNIALGYRAGYDLTSGSNNIDIGNSGAAGESATIRIGTAGSQTRAFIAGIRGVTTGNANAIPVLIDSAGQLGTLSSSRRFKKEIADMGDRTERLLELRPVVFRYEQEQAVESGEVPLEYGLIAEEVAEIFPDLVVHDEEGQPFTVKYHLLSSMLLNELKSLHGRLEAQGEAHARELKEHARELSELRSRLAAVESRTTSAAHPAAPRR